MKDLVIFWGWTRNEKSYQGLINSAPKDWKVYPVSYEYLMPHGNLRVFKQNFLEYLKQNNLEKFYLMGHSLGGALALEFAYYYPEKVKELFLIDSEGVYEPQPIFQIIKNVFRQHPKYKNLPHHRWTSFRRILRHPVLHTKLGYHAHNIDLQEEAKNLKVPTTIIWGEDDHLTPINQGQRLHQLISNSEFISLANEGHDWILYSPELFWQNI